MDRNFPIRLAHAIRGISVMYALFNLVRLRGNYKFFGIILNYGQIKHHYKFLPKIK